MSSTNSDIGVMSPEQERMLYEIAQKVQNVHAIIYENGFQQRMQKLEHWIDNAPENHFKYCPIKPVLDAHIEQNKKEKEVEKEQKQVKREWTMRRGDWFYMGLAIIVALVASVPAWINFIVGE